jgi:hypothetical protein
MTLYLTMNMGLVPTLAHVCGRSAGNIANALMSATKHRELGTGKKCRAQLHKQGTYVLSISARELALGERLP